MVHIILSCASFIFRPVSINKRFHRPHLQALLIALNVLFHLKAMFDSCPLEAVFFHFGSASFGDPSDLATIMERTIVWLVFWREFATVTRPRGAVDHSFSFVIEDPVIPQNSFYEDQHTIAEVCFPHITLPVICNVH